MDTSAIVSGEGRREQNKRDKLERIVAAAREAFTSRGYSQTTLREVAAAAGVASGTIFLYTPTKEDLLCIVFKREMIPVINASFDTLPAGSFLFQMRYLFCIVADHHSKNMALSAHFLKEFNFMVGPVRVEFDEFMDSWRLRLTDVVKGAQARGEILAHVDCKHLAAVCMREFFSLQRVWVAGRLSRKDFDEELMASYGLLLSGVGAGFSNAQGQVSPKRLKSTRQR